jgi:hypothetical protein
MDTHHHSRRQEEQDLKASYPSKPPRLIGIVCFIIAVVFIIAGMLICILNIVNIIPGPWSAIIGVIFAGIGLIVAFYVLFFARGEENMRRSKAEINQES